MTAPALVRRLVTLLIPLWLVSSSTAQDPLDGARALLASWHLEGARIDQARALLESEAAARPAPDTLVELARAWFLTGDVRATSAADKAAAYERGRDAAKRAIALAPRNDHAYLWFALNTGRYAETRGTTTGLTMLPTIREASDTVLRLNPSNVDGLVLAGGILAHVPRVMGGDRAKAEAHFRRALELDPHKTSARAELAELYLAMKRWADARRELQALLDERTPSDLPRWTTREVPRARALLADLAERAPLAGQAP